MLRATNAHGESVSVCEQNALVLVWSGPDEPEWFVQRVPELDDERWTAIRWRRLGPFHARARTIMRDVVDNGHFEPVHGLMGAQTRAWAEGPCLRTVSQGEVGIPRRLDRATRRGLTPRGHLRLEGRLHGPCLLSYRGTLRFGFRLEHILLSAVVPTQDDHTVAIWIGVTIQRMPPVPSSIVVRRLLDDLERDYEKDAPLWRHPAASLDERTTDAAVTDADARLFSIFDDWYACFGEGDRAS